MKLKSFGCSFIFGTDLADDGKGTTRPTASKHSWPALLSKQLNYEYDCFARPGSGNLQIAERVLSHAVDPEPSFFVIGWSWIDRFDYTNSIINNDPQSSKWWNWRTLMPIDTNNLAKTYYKGLHTEYRDKLTSLMSIKLVIDTLNQKNIPFLMTYMDYLLFDSQWHYTPAVIDLQNFIKPYMTDFEGQNFLDWSRKNKFEISPTLHPLESAHASASEYIFKVFDKQKTVDQVPQALS